MTIRTRYEQRVGAGVGLFDPEQWCEKHNASIEVRDEFEDRIVYAAHGRDGLHARWVVPHILVESHRSGDLIEIIFAYLAWALKQEREKQDEG